MLNLLDSVADNYKLLAIALGLFILILLNKSQTKSQQLPPIVPYYFPFIGNLIQMATNPLHFFIDSYNTFGDIFTFVMFGRRMTFVLGADGSNFFFNAKTSQVSAEEAYRSLTVPVFGKDVVYDVPNSVLMEQKRFIKSGLSNEALRAYVPMIEEETNQFVCKWKESNTIDLQSSMAELTIMTASRCLLGKEIRARLDTSVARLFEDLDKGFTPLNFLFSWLPLPSFIKRDAAHKKMTNLFLSIMNERRVAGDMNNIDMLQNLMEMNYKDGRKITDTEVAHLMIALLMAGQHTSSTTSTWCLLHLADNPKVVSEIRAEFKRIVGDGKLDFEKLKEMNVLDSCIRETLRIHPPIITIIRKVIEPISYKGIVIPKGHYICASPAVSQLDSKIYSDAFQWKPSRWNLEEVNRDDSLKGEGESVDYGFGLMKTGSANSPYLPFGAGRHRCIGEAFAYIQLKTLIATILMNYDLELDEKVGMPKSSYASMIVMPESPCLVRYKKRGFE